MKWCFPFLLAVVTAVVPTTAHAQPTSSDSGERSWYGWQVLLVDIAFIGGTAATFATYQKQSPAVSAVPIVGYVAASPILHVVHKEHRSALISGAIRLVPAVLGGLTRAAMADDSCVSVHSDGTRDTYGCLGQGLVILAGGIATGATAIAVTAVDAAVLAYEPAAPAKRTSFWVGPMPVLDGASARVGATIGGTF